MRITENRTKMASVNNQSSKSPLAFLSNEDSKATTISNEKGVPTPLLRAVGWSDVLPVMDHEIVIFQTCSKHDWKNSYAGMFIPPNYEHSHEYTDFANKPRLISDHRSQ